MGEGGEGLGSGMINEGRKSSGEEEAEGDEGEEVRAQDLLLKAAKRRIAQGQPGVVP